MTPGRARVLVEFDRLFESRPARDQNAAIRLRNWKLSLLERSPEEWELVRRVRSSDRLTAEENMFFSRQLEQIADTFYAVGYDRPYAFQSQEMTPEQEKLAIEFWRAATPAVVRLPDDA